jgi:hypothetical protein
MWSSGQTPFRPRSRSSFRRIRRDDRRQWKIAALLLNIILALQFTMENTQQERSANGVAIKMTYFIAETTTEDFSGGDANDGTSGTEADASTVKMTTKVFDASNTAETIVGLPPGSQPVAPQPGDYSYSGMHDQGPLPELKQGGPMAVLLGCAQAAKDYNNTFLTSLIEQEKQKKHGLSKSNSSISSGPSAKKSKMHTDTNDK